jgi:LDH2 family malate/lactate/ureidoglycolate dehydrogenase
MTTEVIDATRLQSACSRVLQHAAVPPADADFVALSLVEADLRGIHSHGSMRLGRYVRELREGISNPRPQIRELETGPAYARLDGDGGLGQLVGRRAMEVCIAKASEIGCATVTAGRSRHFGAAGFFALMALERNLIGIAMTVASPRLAPTGGRLPLFGNNPLAVAIPGTRSFPLLVDFAVGSNAAGNLELAAASGRAIPAGVARDAEGNPTTDPAAALKGTIVPIAEHKGYGLTLLIEILAGLLSGSPYFGVEKKRVDEHVRDTGIGHFFMAVDPARFLPLAQFEEAVARMVIRTKASPRMADAAEILLPGEREARLREQRLREGVPLPAVTVEKIRTLGRACGVEL